MSDQGPPARPHIYLPGHGKKHSYTARGGGGGNDIPPERDRAKHAEKLTAQLRDAVRAAERQLANRDASIAGGTPGFYLEFEMPRSEVDVVDKLEKLAGRSQIELAAVRVIDDEKVSATVFVPRGQDDYFANKVAKYADPTQDTKKGNPANAPLVSAIDSIRLALVESLYTDKTEQFPPHRQETWWEVWLRLGSRTTFLNAAAKLGLRVRDHVINFPDREVVLLCAAPENLGKIIANTDAVAELRLARDTPALFMSMNGAEQRQWSDDVAARLVEPSLAAPAVCLLDSGTTIRHPLIRCALDPKDQQAYNATWSAEDGSTLDHGGHGTQLSGLALHGDLVEVLAGHGPIALTHRLESVKILPDRGANEPDLYGDITAQAVYRAEVAAPQRPRAVCLAVTAGGDHWLGRPSSWSASLDKLAYGEGENARLLLVSAGNIGVSMTPSDYLIRNDATPIESPAQAWNALSVGAYADKAIIVDAAFSGWGVLASVGDLNGTSRTSVSWTHDWPLKPDIVMDGGNHGVDPATGAHDFVDDLSLLTTNRQVEAQPFTTTGETSAATALAARMAAQILAKKPQLWPETVRALMVHSAEWTPAMRNHFDKERKQTVLRRYGYGVPSLRRALRSLDSDVTLVIENTLTPFRLDGTEVKTAEMVVHDLPWPQATLEAHGGTDVELQVTLSYFIEPNPGERGETKRHRYASYGLRFDVKRSTESPDEFLRRRNAAAGDRPSSERDDNRWKLGSDLRSRGSIHSDTWNGSAADLAARGQIAVYPVGGWWRENRKHKRYARSVRYTLLVTLRTQAGINLYVEITNAVNVPVAVGV